MKAMFKSLLPLAALIFLTLSGCDKSKDEENAKTSAKENAKEKTLDKKLEAQLLNPTKKRKPTNVTIGTGGVTGVYYPTGAAIARILNIKFDEHKIKFAAKATKGSVFNIDGVMAGELEFGIAQSDRQYQAVYGEKEWSAKGPQEDLRSVFSIHSETITLVASGKSGIKKAKDVAGKNINLGTLGSGHFGNALDVLRALGMRPESVKPKYFNVELSSEKIQEGVIDAFFYTVGHPNAEIREASYGRIKIMIVPLVGPKIEALIKKKPYYTESSIFKSQYPAIMNKEDIIPSFGVKATLVTSREVDDDIVYIVTKAIFKNVDELKEFHPALKYLRRGHMLKGLSAPLHAGALKYYKEKGITDFIDPSVIR